MGILQAQTGLVAEFQAINAWEDRYRRIIAYGRALPPMPTEAKIPANQVRGCASMVWLTASLVDGKVVFQAESDALIVQGLVALLLKVYSGHSPDDILDAPPDFIEELGLNAHLSANRANGLAAMTQEIMRYAMAFRSVADAGGT